MALRARARACRRCCSPCSPIWPVLVGPPQLVFTEVALGAVVLTANVLLLGGSIVFFQSLCLIGYCLAPICLGALLCTIIKLSVSTAAAGGASVGSSAAVRSVATADAAARLRPPSHAQWVRTLVLVVCLGWSSFAAVPFIGKTVCSECVWSGAQAQQPGTHSCVACQRFPTGRSPTATTCLRVWPQAPCVGGLSGAADVCVDRLAGASQELMARLGVNLMW